MNLFFEDDRDILELIEYGFPRQIFIRTDHYYNLDDLSFYRRFRLRKETVLQLLPLLEAQLEHPTNMNNSVSPMNQLLLTLRFYATGNHQVSVADFSGVHISTACRIIRRVSEAIAQLYEIFIKMPTTPEDIQQTQNKFFEIASFPRIVVAIDGTHVKIQSVGGYDAELYRNRKSYFSINVQAVCNAKLEFLNVVARWPGSTHDATIYNNSNLRAEFEVGLFRNCILLGDSGYPLRPYFFTPLLEVNTPAQIENILTIIIATAVLHNICQKASDHNLPPGDDNIHELEELINIGQIPNIANHNENALGLHTRKQYFSNL